MSLLPFRKESQLSLGELQEQMNLLFNRLWHGGLSTRPFDGQDWAPSLDVREDPECYVVQAEVPGLKVEDIELTYVGNSLTLKGEKLCEAQTESKTGCLCRERRFGSFSRSITLPEKIEADKISATCRNGVLEVVLPKVEEFKPKPIKIEVEE